MSTQMSASELMVVSRDRASQRQLPLALLVIIGALLVPAGAFAQGVDYSRTSHSRSSTPAIRTNGMMRSGQRMVDAGQRRQDRAVSNAANGRYARAFINGVTGRTVAGIGRAIRTVGTGARNFRENASTRVNNVALRASARAHAASEPVRRGVFNVAVRVAERADGGRLTASGPNPRFVYAGRETQRVAPDGRTRAGRLDRAMRITSTTHANGHTTTRTDVFKPRVTRFDRLVRRLSGR